MIISLMVNDGENQHQPEASCKIYVKKKMLLVTKPGWDGQRCGVGMGNFTKYLNLTFLEKLWVKKIEVQ